MELSPPNVLLILAAAAVVIAIGLSGGSLGKSVKWNSMDSATDWGGGGYISKLSAYQTLWGSYDKSDGTVGEYVPVYAPVLFDFQVSWRPKARMMIVVSVALGTVSLLVLLCGTLGPMINKKTVILNLCRIVSSVLSVSSGVLSVYTLHYYKTHYPLLNSEFFKDPRAMYPDEDNVSVGFYMTASACALYFTSAVLNIITIAVQKLVKHNNNAVSPTPDIMNQ